ncbi:MAG: tetratricopeptide repeat protein [Acidobacteriaceae bacterium]
MSVGRVKVTIGAIALLFALSIQSAWAGNLRIYIPKRSELTPVQRLNRDGVEAVRKHNYEKAEALFYKAYLYDPADPFTLNNLGYISELNGNLDRAQKFYSLASKQGCNALVDLSSAKQLEGKPMTYALNDVKDLPMRVNQMNVAAVELLSRNRTFEANKVLRQALAIDPRDPFTLNNLAVADEATGDLQDALKYYDQAAGSHSSERIVVTMRREWRGKPVSEVAAESARQLRDRLRNLSSAQSLAMMLTYRGVAAVNRNDWAAAKKDFLKAYALDPTDAFAINNRGYVAEKSGDIETAQSYYAKARAATGSNALVGLATNSLAEGEPLESVATGSDHAINRQLIQYQRVRREETGPIVLIPRGPSASNPPANARPPAAPQPQP